MCFRGFQRLSTEFQKDFGLIQRCSRRVQEISGPFQVCSRPSQGFHGLPMGVSNEFQGLLLVFRSTPEDLMWYRSSSGGPRNVPGVKQGCSMEFNGVTEAFQWSMVDL